MRKRRIYMMVALALCGCAEQAEFVYGQSVGGDLLALSSEDEGVHPSTAALDNPANPFRMAPVGEETRWDIQSAEDPVLAFYSWASTLARQPSGENQFYAAQNLQRVYNNGMAAQSELDLVRQLALKGYQAVLDHFPDSVTYDDTGTSTYDMATPAYQGIVQLGGTPTGGWVLLAIQSETGEGASRAVKP